MNFIIETTSPSDLNQILELNQKALPAVSSVNLKEMRHFLKIVDYFKTLKINNKVAGFLIALTPGKIITALIINGLRTNMNHSCMSIE